MEFFISLCYVFFIGSITGWIMELFYRRWAGKEWVNPGFLVGPYLPIYGIGLVTLFLFSKIEINFIDNKLLEIAVFFIMIMLVMTIIEFIAGLIFIKGLKVKLWDYSKSWGNILGIICPTFSLCWGIIGTAYYYFINPLMVDFTAKLNNSIIYAFIIGILVGVFIIDCAYSFKIADKIKKYAKENKLVIAYEKLKESFIELQKNEGRKTKFFTLITTQKNLINALENYSKTTSKNNESNTIINRLKFIMLLNNLLLILLGVWSLVDANSVEIVIGIILGVIIILRGIEKIIEFVLNRVNKLFIFNLVEGIILIILGILVIILEKYTLTAFTILLLIVCVSELAYSLKLVISKAKQKKIFIGEFISSLIYIALIVLLSMSFSMNKVELFFVYGIVLIFQGLNSIISVALFENRKSKKIKNN